MALRGQLIVLPGIQAPAAPGAVKLNVSAADRIASSMPYIHRAMAPKSLVALPEGGVSGYCRVTGEKLLQKGSSPSVLRLSIVGGKPALGFSADDSLGSLAFQPGSMPTSYTVVMLVSITEPTNRLNFMMGYTGETAIATVLRYDTTTASPEVKRLIAYGSTNSAPYAETPRPAGTWAIVVVDYDDATKKVSIAVNQVDTFVENTKSTASAAAADSYLEIGYHGSGNSLRLAKVGDTFVFNRSLRTSPTNLAQLAQLVAALKTEYGIA
ncbi:hypothetical protein [Pseudomonas sp. JR33AA]|uniref:hypothetical protein n=1 Tax=Pseudomonas sp. JR33AA TaxID=2899113 RepID=UPI001F32C1E0|nr:hypothetical protein [Pseudomonas sp. JR33AA]MCE5976632.1 hypothetical protein [Pseudomonas sp. JR33AA]